MNINTGDTVQRPPADGAGLAVVVEVIDATPESPDPSAEAVALISYAEGGSGWWPMSSLTPAPPAPAAEDAGPSAT